MGDSPSDRSAGRATPRSDLIRLVYVSMMARPLSSDDLAHIKTRSERYNDAAGITGLLIAQGRFFYGVMEGPRRKVLQRMEVIIADNRHRGIRILAEEAIRDRRFENWTFGQVPEDPKQRHGTAGPAGFILELSRRLG
jgi:hypothetical protein